MHIGFKPLAALLLTLTFTTATGQKPFELGDLDQLYTLTDPQISPDGKSILIVVSKPDTLNNRNRTFLYRIDVASGFTQQLTFERASVSSPRWSPSGDSIAFISADASAKSQIFMMSMKGGEAKKLTSSSTGVQQFAWSPDGSKIGFVQEDELNRKEIEKGYDAFDVKHNGMYLTSRPTPSHIWLIPVAGGEAKRVTSGSWTLPNTSAFGASPAPISWTPDGKRIAFQSNESPYQGELIFLAKTVDVVTGKIDRVTSVPVDSKGMHRERLPQISPDGRSIAYLYQLKNVGYGSDVYFISVNGGPEKNLTAPLDRCFFRAEWSADSKALFVAANDFNTVSLWMQPLNGSARKISLGNLCITGAYWYHFNVGRNNAIAFVASTPQSPQELYYLDGPEASPTKLTNFHHEMRSLLLGKQETFTWTSDGMNMNGILTFPPNFDPAGKYPVVLEIHGGPRSSSKEMFNASTQLKASRGYIVFQPNYRGSDNMGYKFSEAISGDMGEGPGRDVMKGLAELKKRSYVDSARVAVTGWSYGGFMTTWLIGHYQGWKCAMAGAAVTDWIDQYAEADFGSIYKYEMGKGISPFTDPIVKENWIRNSPFTHAEKVTTPTLFMSNTGDERVPISQSYKFYRVLHDRGVDTRFIVFPIPGHIPTDPVRTKEMNRYILEWLDRYL